MSDEIQHAAAVLAGELLAARQVYDDTLASSSAGREGAKASLAAVLTFLQSLPGVRELRLDLPLGVLGRALIDLDRGAVEPMLRAAATGSRPVRLDLELLRSFAAGAAELFCRAGLRRQEAYELVAARLDSDGFRRDARQNRITGQTVRAWRKALGEAEAADPARIRYENVIRPENVIDPKLAAEEVLKVMMTWRPSAPEK